MKNENVFKYDMMSVSQMMDGYYIQNRNDLFRFCRSFGVIVGSFPNAQFVAKGYFTIEFRKINCGTRFKTHPKILVSDAGVKFLNKLVKIIYDGK